MAEVIHEYFKKQLDDFKILVRVNPKSLEGLELIVANDGRVKKTERQFEEDIYDDLEADEFEKSSPLEFNLHLKNITK